ncbi:hypothetical protein HZA43_03170 [Candidatus Peregrinibacteria bacterium]|nr:hypothetical protein [Candidatus Peregrinibacteria bacterium]
MRAILTISMPVEAKKEVEKRARRVHKTTSGYLLDALKIVEQMISEEELLAMSKTAGKNYKQGKTKALKSLNDLIQK